MATMAEKIALLMQKKNISEEDMARRLGVGNMTVRRYLTGYSEPFGADLAAIASLLEVSEDYLLGKQDFMALSEPIARIPVFNDFPCGEENDEIKPLEYICGSYGTQSVKNCFFVVANDDSMSGAKITVGDKVLINPERAVVSGDLAAVSVEGGKPLIRRVYFDGSRVLLNSEGIEPSSVEIDINKTKVEFLGAVVFIISYPT